MYVICLFVIFARFLLKPINYQALAVALRFAYAVLKALLSEDSRVNLPVDSWPMLVEIFLFNLSG